MATPPWTTAEAAAFEVERARLLSVADAATRREFYCMLAVRKGARAAAARQGAICIRTTTPHTCTSSAAVEPAIEATDIRWREIIPSSFGVGGGVIL